MCWGKLPVENEAKIWYKISIKTSDAYCETGTDSTISLNLIGQNGNVSTGFFELDNFLKHDFEKGVTEHFNILAIDIGLPIVIRIKLDKTHKRDEWFCDQITVTVKANGDKAYFPVYDWVVNGMQITRGEAILPQKVTNSYMKSLRRAEIDSNRALYEWVPLPTKGDIGWGFPRYVKAKKYSKLPPLFKRTCIRKKDMNENKFITAVNLIRSLLESKIKPLTDLDSYHQLSVHNRLQRQNPHYLENWDSDESMGRQLLTGISPLMISRCSALPDYFNVNNDDVITFLSNGKTLQEEIAAGKVYISDYNAVLAGIKRNTDPETKLKQICPNAVGLFYVNNQGNFLPIALQLVPGDRDYLFTPADTKDDWLLAKMYFRTAETSQHEWVYHFLLTHNIVEPFSVALFRCLPRSHPVYKLMRPHLQTVSAINTDAREYLITPASQANNVIAISATALARETFKHFTFEDLVIPKRLKKQGLDDPALLPNCYYRDDALALWKIMKKFVSSVLHQFYQSDSDVCEDYELQSWAEDVTQNGLGWQDNNARGMPEKITTIDTLDVRRTFRPSANCPSPLPSDVISPAVMPVEICVTLMFTSSVQHAAVNFGQFQTYKFAPNCPSSMRLPPHRKGEATKQRIMDSLPSARSAITVIAITFVLSEFSQADVYLGQYPNRFFTEQAVLDIMMTYQRDLKIESDRITKRNDILEHPYTFLLPDRVPNSIAI